MIKVFKNQFLTSKNINFFSLTYKDTLRAMSAETSKLLFKEVEGDLFSAPSNYSLAHCVAADMGMGAGIAVKFKQIFGKREELLAQNIKTGGVATLLDDSRFIYYLVTKEHSGGKPTYDSLRSSLNEMKNHMVKNDVKHLAMPRIGCGIDGLEWDKVSSEIKAVFSEQPIEIVAYNFVPK